MTIDPDTAMEIALALARHRNDDGDMSDGGRTRAEVLEAPESDADVEIAVGRDA